MLVRTKRSIALLLTFLMIVTSVQFMGMPAVYADAATIDSVRAAIQALSADPTEYTASDKAAVEAIQADFESLSPDDQATLDAECTHSGTGQSLGRVLESALWSVWSYETDISTTLPNGTYDTATEPAVSSVSSKGKSDSSRVRNWWVESVVVKNGQAIANIYVTSGAATAKKVTSYPSVWIGGKTINITTDNTYPIPVDLNGTTYFGGISSSMPTPIMYALDTTITEPKPVELGITNNTGMFKAVTASLVKAGDKRELTMALSSTGYHELFKGTYEEAVENGDGSADKGDDSWIHGYVNAAGKWEFKVPLKDDETYVPLVAISDSYYGKYLDGQNDLARAFYPRQITVDSEAKTLVTGDYEQTVKVAVTNNVKMFKPGTSADVHVVGGPNSNNYAVTMTLPMQSDSFSKVKATKYKIENGVLKEDGEKEIDLADGKFTDIPVIGGKQIVLQFWSVKNECWYKRSFTLDLANKTAVFDPYQAKIEELEGMTTKDAVTYVTDYKSVELMDALIEAIQVQVRNENTDKYCTVAKACWDALTDAQKEEVEEADYFGLDTGDASKDDPLNKDNIGEKELLVVSFGTSFNDSRATDIGGVEKALAEANPGWDVRRAFTAQIIINHIASRDSEQIDNVEQALDRAAANGVKELVIQPTHLMHGSEYDELVKALEPYKAKIEKITVAEPLLGPVGEKDTDINADKKAVAKAVVSEAVKVADFKSIDEMEKAKVALVLMGHGTEHAAAKTYTQMQNQMNELGFKNVFIGTVEGRPAETALPAVKNAVEEAGYTKVILRPLMVVAGDHANNDMAADEEGSWYYAFVNGGEFEVEGADEPVDIGKPFGKDNVDVQIEGLGRIKAVQKLYVKHTNELTNSPIELDITNNTGMFKAVTASLVKEDGKQYLVMALSSTGYHELFKGTYEEAVANGDGSADKGDDSWIHGYVNTAGKWEFKVPLKDDETYVPLVAVSDSYYGKYLDGQNDLARAFYPRQVTVDREAMTLLTEDFNYEADLAVTNGVTELAISAARLACVGGPNSNGYKATLSLAMGDDTWIEAFIGTAEEAAKADETNKLSDEKVFTIPVRWMKTAGKPETITDYANGEPFTLSLKDKDEWVEFDVILSEAEAKLAVNADYAVVREVIESLPDPSDLKLSDRAAVKDARAQYDALDDNEKARVTNLSVLEVAEATIAKLKAEAALAKANEALETANANLTKTKTDLRKTEAELERAKAELEKAKADFDTAAAALEKAKADLDKVSSDFDKTSADLEKANADLSKAKTDLEKAMSDFNKTSADLEKANAELAKSKQDAEASQAEIQALKARLRILNTKVKKVKAKGQKGKARITWKSAGKGYKYVVYRSGKVSGGFKKVKTAGGKKAVIKKLKSGKTYYFKVRAFKTIDGKKVYTQFSDTVGVKIK